MLKHATGMFLYAGTIPGLPRKIGNANTDLLFRLYNLFLDALMYKYLAGRVISMTTFREGDKSDTGYRELLKHLGFAEQELLIEYAYPTQRFIKKPEQN